MNDNDFDKAGRAWLHLDPTGSLRWLLPELRTDCTFQRWAETRTIAFPGEPDRTCDTVAELLQDVEPPLWWLLVIEVQSDLDGEIFGRLLEYLGRLWRGLHPRNQSRQRNRVVAALVNFKGRGSNSRDFRLPGTRDALACASSKRTSAATTPKTHWRASKAANGHAPYCP